MSQPKRIICVSHLTGAEGDAVARGVAERLGFRFLDEEIIETAAEWVELHPSIVGEVERRKTLMTRLAESMKGQSLPTRPDASGQSRSGTAALREKPTDEDLRTLITDAIREAAQEGDIVIASHAASVVLADRKDALRVLITASQKSRVARTAGARNLDARQAEKVVADEDAARAEYLKRFYGIELELPIHYDLVVNTDELTPELGADLIKLAADFASER
jgi:cytidylate kinase